MASDVTPCPPLWVSLVLSVGQWEIFRWTLRNKFHWGILVLVFAEWWGQCCWGAQLPWQWCRLWLQRRETPGGVRPPGGLCLQRLVEVCCCPAAQIFLSLWGTHLLSLSHKWGCTRSEYRSLFDRHLYTDMHRRLVSECEGEAGEKVCV